MGGGNETDVHLFRLRRADRPHYTFLQHTQQFDLQRQGHVADFIEKQGAPVGGLDQTSACCCRAGEGTARVTE